MPTTTGKTTKKAAAKQATAARKATVAKKATAPKPGQKRRKPPAAPPGVDEVTTVDGVLRFRVGDTWHEMPDAAAAAARLPGGMLLDASRDPSLESKFAFSMLEASDIFEDTYQALRRLPAPDLLDLVQRWMLSQSDGATVGESSSS